AVVDPQDAASLLRQRRGRAEHEPSCDNDRQSRSHPHCLPSRASSKSNSSGQHQTNDPRHQASRGDCFVVPLLAMTSLGDVIASEAKQSRSGDPELTVGCVPLVRVSSGTRRRYEATNETIRCPAKNWSPVRILAPQHGAIRYWEPAGIVGIVGKNQDFP